MPENNDRRFKITKLVRKQIPENLDSKSMFCPFCGRIQSSEALFCGFCGKKIPNEEKKPTKIGVGNTINYKGKKYLVTAKNAPAGKEVSYELKNDTEGTITLGEETLLRGIDSEEEDKGNKTVEAVQFCPFCGKEQALSAVFCGYCGEKIKDREDKLEIVPPQPEIEEEQTFKEMERQLVVARSIYAEGYKKFTSDRKKGLGGRLKQAKELIFGGTVHDKNIPPELKRLEEEYDKAAVALGNEMFANGVGKSEIFKRVVIQEQEELAKIKVENLPPKEKGILRKGLDKYMALPRPVKIGISIVLSTGAIATFSWATIAGAGGLAAYTTVKIIRSTIGVAATQGTIKAFNLTFKEKSGEKRAESEKNLVQKFTPDDLSAIKKEYTEILEQERKRKRNRIIAKGVLGLAVGGAASLGAGYATGAIHDGIYGGNKTDEELTSELLKQKDSGITNTNPASVDNFTNKGISIEHGKGAISAIRDLQSQIKIQYPNGDYPESVKDFMNTDATKEAIKLGFYDPNKVAESALIQEGSVLKFQDGKIMLGKTDASGKFMEWNKKDMIDTDSKPKIVRHETTRAVHTVHKASPVEKIDDIKPKIENGINEKTMVTGQTIQTGGATVIDEAIVSPKAPAPEEIKVSEAPKPTPTPEATATTEPKSTPESIKTPEEISKSIKTQIEITEKYPVFKGTEFAKNKLNLPEEKLVETYKVYEENIKHITKGASIKDFINKVGSSAANNYIGADSVEGDLVTPYINKISYLANLTPDYNPITKDESVHNFLERCILQLTKEGRLDEIRDIKYK